MKYYVAIQLYFTSRIRFLQSISKTELETSRKPTFRKGQRLLVSTRRNRPALTKNIGGLTQKHLTYAHKACKI